jgi:hypothetical protein
MPNWCANDLWIRGDPENVQKFVKYAASPDSQLAFDFNRFVQMPEGLESVSAGSEELVYNAWYGSDDTVARMLAYRWVVGKASDREGLKALLAKKYPDGEQEAEMIAKRY